MEPAGLCNARAMLLMDSPAFHRSHNSFLPAADNPPGRPSLATPAPPIRTTPKTLPCCTDRLNPPWVLLSSDLLAGYYRHSPVPYGTSTRLWLDVKHARRPAVSKGLCGFGYRPVVPVDFCKLVSR